MSDLRKLVMAAIFGGDLSDDPNCETALDRVMAFAWSDALGGALWRLKWGYDANAFERALHLIVDRYRRRHEKASFGWARRLSMVVLNEWLDDTCAACGGRRFIMATESAAKHSCPACSGTGLRRPSEQRRMRDLGLTPRAYPKWENRFEYAHEIIAVADWRAWRDVAKHLGRERYKEAA